MWREYFTAASIEDVKSILNLNIGRAKIIAGGTDLILEFERELRNEIEVLVDVSRIAEMNSIEQTSDGIIHIGACVTHNQVVDSPLLRKSAFPLVKACWEVGSPQIRNRGTVVGNLVTGSPANDTIPALMALEAKLVLTSVHGERIVALSDFYLGVRKSVLKPEEVVTEIQFQGLNEDQHGTFIKYALRNAQAISVVNAAAVLTFEGKKITEAKITLGAVSPTIIRAAEAEKCLIGRELSEEHILNAAEKATLSARPISDIRGSAEFRKYLVKIVVKQALMELMNQEEMSAVPEDAITLRGQEMTAPPAVNRFVHAEGASIECMINGVAYKFEQGFNKTLLDLLREDAGLVGTKEGCAEGECGACTVFLDGIAVMACMVPAPRAHGAQIVTIEGIADGEMLHPVQSAFISEGAVQCGYCTPGFIMSAVKLLEETPTPSQSQIRQALTGNLCRCTGYYKIIQAVERAAAGG